MIQKAVETNHDVTKHRKYFLWINLNFYKTKENTFLNARKKDLKLLALEMRQVALRRSSVNEYNSGGPCTY